jgi:hypothetical protein
MSGHAVGGRNPEIRSEKSDAHPPAILRFLLWLLFGTIAVVILMRWLFVSLAAFEERQQPPAPVMKAANAHAAPLPRLQTHPTLELADYNRQQDEILHGYGWVDTQAGIVHIDIDEAMRLTAERGLPAGSPEASKVNAPPQEGKSK